MKNEYQPFEGREDDLQISCITLARYKWPNKTIFHCPNGGKRHAREAHKFKQMGVLPGIPDVLCINPVNKYKGLAIELKTKTGRTTKHQQKMLDEFALCGWFTALVRSVDEFEDALKYYFDEQ